MNIEYPINELARKSLNFHYTPNGYIVLNILFLIIFTVANTILHPISIIYLQKKIIHHLCGYLNYCTKYGTIFDKHGDLNMSLSKFCSEVNPAAISFAIVLVCQTTPGDFRKKL